MLGVRRDVARRRDLPGPRGAWGRDGYAPHRCPTRKRRRQEAISTFSTIGSAAFAGKAFVALYMTWGAINEWTTQAGFARLIERANHSTLRELLKRIMNQEGGHIDFYASEATRRLSDSPRAQKLTRFALNHFWRPVGSGVMPNEEVGFLVKYLFDGSAGAEVAARIDRRVDQLPGQEHLHLLETAVSRSFSGTRTLPNRHVFDIQHRARFEQALNTHIEEMT